MAYPWPLALMLVEEFQKNAAPSQWSAADQLQPFAMLEKAVEEKRVWSSDAFWCLDQDMAIQNTGFQPEDGYWGKNGSGQELATEEASIFVRNWLLRKNVFWPVAGYCGKSVFDGIWRVAGLWETWILESSWLSREMIEETPILVSSWLFSKGILVSSWLLRKKGFWSVAVYWKTVDVVSSWTEEIWVFVSSRLLRKLDLVSTWLLRKNGFCSVGGYWENVGFGEKMAAEET